MSQDPINPLNVLSETVESLRKRLIKVEDDIAAATVVAPPLPKQSFWVRLRSYATRRIVSFYSPIMLGGVFILSLIQPAVVIFATVGFFTYLSIRVVSLNPPSKGDRDVCS